MDLAKILNIYQRIIEAPLLQYQIFGNTVGGFIMAIGAFIVFLFVFNIFQSIVLRRLGILAEKTKTDIDDTLIKVVKSLRPPFYSFIAFYFAVQFLTLGSTLCKVLDAFLVIWVVYQVIIAVQILIEYIFVKALKDEEDKSAKGAFGVIKNVIRALLWMVGILLILSNMGVNITSLIAGLGIGGIAIAFAFQNILEDLFSSFAILFDKPFKVGDFVIVGEHKGVVQKIGIKTTRLKSLSGEEIVISNK
ncbi:MAG: mechanosensitive ion channel, partial [Candidatus Pacebacteria bacterium]|nr:mechanosensitive ion channel [Candidatus Paceibacterota bacterium]